MAIQARRGNEADFDPNKMLPGEWAVSLDTKYVRMCFSPGVCLRMATYEGFEADMAQIQQILSEVRTAEEAIRKIQSEVNAQAEIVDENTDLCEEYARRAENAADRAEAVTDIHYATKDRAGIVAPQDIHVDEQGNMVMIAETTDSMLRNSYAGGIQIEIHGKYEQDGEPTPNNPIDIKKSVVSEVLTHHKNFLIPPPTTNKNGIELVVDDNGYMTFNGTASVTSYFTVYQKNELPIGNKYALSATDPLPSGVSFVIRNRDSSATTYQLTDTKQAVTFANDRITEKNWVAILVVEAGKTFTNARFAVQLEEGTSVTDYAPYTESVATLSEPIKLGGIGDVADVLDAKETKRRFATFEPTPSMFGKSSNTTADRFVLNTANFTQKPKVLGLGMCNMFVWKQDTNSGIGKCWIDGNLNFICDVSAYGETTLEQFRELITATPIIIHYELAEPTTEALPTADQIALNSLKSFDGVTYVETDSEVKPTIYSKYGTSKVGAMALELQNENANLKLQMNNAKATEITETKVSFPAKMGTDTVSGIWNVELQRPTDADYTLLGWTIINPKANVANVYVSTVDGYTLSGDIVESGAHAAFSVTIRAMWAKS